MKLAVPAFSPSVCVVEQPISMAASHTPATASSSIKLEKRDSAVQDIRQAVPAFSSPVCVEEQTISMAASHTPATASSSTVLEMRDSAVQDKQKLEAVVVEHLQEMKI